MAANLAGMMAQLNNVIGQAPTGGELLDLGSQGIGGMMGGMTGRDPMSFMSQGGQQLQANREMQGVDMNTLAGLQQAAQIAARSGNVEQAQKLSILAEKKRQTGMAEMADNQEQMKKESAKTKAAAMAMKNGDRAAHQAIVGGFMEPEAYIAYVMKEDEDFTLGRGQVRFKGGTGDEIARGPAYEHAPRGGGSAGDSVYINRTAREYTDAAQGLLADAEGTKQLVADMTKAVESDPLWTRGGAQATAKEATQKFLGTPDEISALKTRFFNKRNKAAVQGLPPGSASDADVKLAMQGWPADDAPMSVMIQFMKGYQKLLEADAMYNDFMADYVGSTGQTLGANAAWKEYTRAEAANNISFDALPDK